MSGFTFKSDTVVSNMRSKEVHLTQIRDSFGFVDPTLPYPWSTIIKTILHIRSVEEEKNTIML